MTPDGIALVALTCTLLGFGLGVFVDRLLVTPAAVLAPIFEHADRRVRVAEPPDTDPRETDDDV